MSLCVLPRKSPRASANSIHLLLRSHLCGNSHHLHRRDTGGLPRPNCRDFHLTGYRQHPRTIHEVVPVESLLRIQRNRRLVTRLIQEVEIALANRAGIPQKRIPLTGDETPRKRSAEEDSIMNKQSMRLSKRDRSVLLKEATTALLRQFQHHAKLDQDVQELFTPPPPHRLVFDSFQRKELRLLLGIPPTGPSRELARCISRINSILRSYHLHRIPFDENADRILDEYLESHGYKMPPFLDFDRLCRETNLTDVKLRFLLRRKVQRHLAEPISEDNKSLLKSLMEQRNYVLPTPEDRDDLQEQTGLSRSQLNSYLHYLRQHRTKITPEAVQKVKEWIAIHPMDAKPSPKERKQLLADTGVSTSQLTNLLIAHAKKGEVTADAKATLRQWLVEVKRRPSTKERQEMRTQLGWSEHQLNSHIAQYFDSQNAGEITKKVKKFVEEWIKEHGTPNVEQKATLEKELCISRKQLNRLILSIQNPVRTGSAASDLTTISEDIKRRVADWLRENHYQLPTADEKEALAQDTGLTKSQVGRLARNELSKMPLHLVQQTSSG